MFDGTLRRDWKAAVVFQQMIIFCDPDGVFDMTPEALHHRTGIPLDIIKEGIKALEMPDPESRSPAEEGRRIVRISDERNWGWQIVNHPYYRDLQRAEDKRAGNRKRQQKLRDKKKCGDVNASQPVTPRNTASRKSRHTDADANANAKRGEDEQSKSLPTDFWYTPEMVAKARAEGLDINFDAETKKFILWVQSKGKTSLNWSSELQIWWQRAGEYLKKNAPPLHDEQHERDILDLAALYKIEREPSESWEAFEARVTKVNNRRLENLESR